MLDYVNTYSALDYMHVPTYVPMFILLIRGLVLLVLFNIGASVVGTGKVLIACVAVLLYFDAILFPSGRGIECYVGGVLPVALALLTNSSVLWSQGEVVVFADFGLLLDVCWAGACITVLMLVSCCSRISLLCKFILALAGMFGAVHVFLFEGVYYTSVSEFVVRIVLFYTCVVMFYALRSVVHVCAQSHALMTLHCSLPILWLQSVVLYLYFVACVVWLLYIILHTGSSTRGHKYDVNTNNTKTLPISALMHQMPLSHSPQAVLEASRKPGALRAHGMVGQGAAEATDTTDSEYRVATATLNVGSSLPSDGMLEDDMCDNEILLHQLRRAKIQQAQALYNSS